jgi:hypothetical protein
MRKAILIVAYNRSKILLSNLQNLKKCKNYYTFKKVLVFGDIIAQRKDFLQEYLILDLILG